jgi:cbb3-type cytochrome oxidase subunit 3
MILGIMTAIFLALFIGGAIWLWQPRLNAMMQKAAAMPLEKDSTDCTVAKSVQGDRHE